MGKACFESRAGIAGHGLFLACDVLNLLMSNPLFFFFFNIINNSVSSGFSGEIF